ncbi:MAG: T9SS type A sorting domain-containing protein [Prevotellaceae bacterium]|jgi:hypothetical protein|nr:T9SS type A sorting domain-containing protein [Prevotellaceae bacterium]
MKTTYAKLKKVLLLAAVLLGFTATGWGQAETIAAWDFNGVSGSTETYAATTYHEGLDQAATYGSITRGAEATASTGGDSFRSTKFGNTGISTAEGSRYFQVTIKPDAEKTVSLSTISGNANGTATFAAAPGVTTQFAYSIDGENFTLIGEPQVKSGNPQTFSIDVSGVAALQNVSGATIYLRYYASGQTTTGGWGFYSASSGANGLEITGVIPSFDPSVSVDQTSLYFGSVKSGATKDLALKATPANLTANLSLNIQSESGAFSVNTASIPQETSTETDITVSFTAPAEQGEYRDTLVISGGGLAAPVKVALSGISAMPSLTVDSVQVQLGGVEVGESKTVSVPIRAVVLQDKVTLTIDGANKDNFAVDSAEYAPGSFTKSARVTYTPSAVGATDQATLTVKSAGMEDKIVSLSGTGIAQIVEYLYEPFEYTAGENIGGNTGGTGGPVNSWSTHSNGASAVGTIDVQSGSLEYSGLLTSKGNMVRLPGDNTSVPRDVNRPFVKSSMADSIYYSALINVADETQLSTTGDYFMGVGTTTLGARLGAKKSGAGYKFIIANSNTTFVEYGTELSFGTVYLVVVKYDRKSVASLWVNPATLGGEEPSGCVATASGSAINTAFSAIGLRNAANTPKVDIDEIRVGRTWKSVTPAATAPAFAARPTVADTTATSANVKVKVDGDATLYYVVKTASVANITAGDVVADEGKKSATLTANVEETIALSELTAETPYYVYMAAENAYGLSEVDSAVFTTLSALAPVITVAPEALTFDTIVGLQQEKTFTVTTANLGENAALTLGQSGAFSLSTESVADNSADINITVTYTAGASVVKDTIYITGGSALAKMVELTGTPRTPVVSASSAKLTFAAVQDVPATQKIVVKGSNLKDGIKLIKSSAAYTLSKDTVTVAEAASATGDTITVTFNAAAATTDTIILRSAGAQSVKIALEGTVRGQYDNMLANPGFETWTETAPDAWTFSSNPTKEVVQKHSGTNSAKVAASARVDITQTILGVEAGKKYDISFWYYMEPASTGNGLRIWSAFRDGSTNISLSADDNAILQPDVYQNTKGQWMQFAISAFEAPATADNFRFEVRTMTGSTVYYDDFSFAEHDEQAPQIVVTPTTLAFGNVGVDESKTDTVQITATNISTDLQLSVSGANASMFSVQSTLTPTGSAQKVAITYTPTAEGSHAATLSIVNGGVEKLVALSGTGFSAASITPIGDIVTGAEASPLADSTVLTTGVVTGVVETGSFFIQQGNRGLYVYRRGSVTPQVGDSVLVRGKVEEYYGLTEITGSTNDDITVASSGNALPAPVVVTLAEYGKVHHGVLVTINNLTVAAAPEGNSRYTVSDSNGDTALVSNELFASASLVEKGDVLHVTGIGFYFNGAQLLPRSAADIEKVASTAANKELANLVTLYPNPVGSMLYINSTLQIVDIQIVSVNGVVLMQSKNQAELNVSSLASGVYIVRITFADGRTTAKLITK